MKKIISIVLVAILALPMVANAKESPEEKATKDYSSWLPTQGEWSIGFGLDPISSFVGNLFNNSTSNKLSALSGEALNYKGLPKSTISIMGTYMLTNNWELRANVGFGFRYQANNKYALDDKALAIDPFSKEKVTDTEKIRDLSGSISFGAQYRVGKTRPVQGVFGVGLMYVFGVQDTRYSYGNAITELNQKPTIAVGTYSSSVAGYMPNARLLSQTTSMSLEHAVGLYGSVGIEWFVAPHICLGANVNLDFLYSICPAHDNKYEGYNILTGNVEEYIEKVNPASHAIDFSTNNIGANLYVAFYLK